jgi:hypothetical protein
MSINNLFFTRIDLTEKKMEMFFEYFRELTEKWASQTPEYSVHNFYVDDSDYEYCEEDRYSESGKDMQMMSQHEIDWFRNWMKILKPTLNGSRKEFIKAVNSFLTQ